MSFPQGHPPRVADKCPACPSWGGCQFRDVVHMVPPRCLAGLNLGCPQEQLSHRCVFSQPFLSSLAIYSLFSHLCFLGSSPRSTACIRVLVSGFGKPKQKQSLTVSPRCSRVLVTVCHTRSDKWCSLQLTLKQSRICCPTPGPLLSLLQTFLRWKALVS